MLVFSTALWFWTLQTRREIIKVEVTQVCLDTWLFICEHYPYKIPIPPNHSHLSDHRLGNKTKGRNYVPVYTLMPGFWRLILFLYSHCNDCSLSGYIYIYSNCVSKLLSDRLYWEDEVRRLQRSVCYMYVMNMKSGWLCTVGI